jgi:S-adenosylmethionine:tRNA ribosyltransferase-isomerase
LDDSLVAEVIDNTTSRGRTLRFLYDGSYEEFRNKLTSLRNSNPKIYLDVTQKMPNVTKLFAKEEGCSCANSRITLFKAFIKN